MKTNTAQTAPATVLCNLTADEQEIIHQARLHAQTGKNLSLIFDASKPLTGTGMILEGRDGMLR